MRKSLLCLVLLVVLLLAAPPHRGVAQAQDNYTIQYITTISGLNYIGFLQGISGWQVTNFDDAALVRVGFNNVVVNGLYNTNIGIGSFRNQGSLAFVNIQPNEIVNPVIFSGQMFSQNNLVRINNFNYAIDVNFNSFRGSGLVLLSLMAGSFSNQFTTLSFNMGKNAVPPTSPSVFNIQKGNPTVASLTNQQMQAIAATANNDIQVQGKQTAMTTVQGSPDVQGVCAMTLSSGLNNLVNHNVSVNIDTAR